jgi:tryptophan halogenase
MWQIPTQTRFGCGYVYSDEFQTPEEAKREVERVLGHEIEVRSDIRFQIGRLENAWIGNVLAVGLSSSFLEPLESTSIHLIQTGISKLFWLFPDKRCSAVERDEYNRMMREQFAYIRDFIVLHYKATARDDTPFWRMVRDMPIPDSLARKIDLFREKGRILRYDHDLFDIPSWVAVMLGQNIIPDGHDAVADALDDERVLAALRTLAGNYAEQAQRMPSHAEYIARFCPAPPMGARA